MNMVIQVLWDKKVSLSALLFPEPQTFLELLVIFGFCPPHPLSFCPFCPLRIISHSHFIQISSTCPLKLYPIPFPPKFFYNCHLLEILFPDPASQPQGNLRCLHDYSIMHCKYLYYFTYLCICEFFEGSNCFIHYTSPRIQQKACINYMLNKYYLYK